VIFICVVRFVMLMVGSVGLIFSGPGPVGLFVARQLQATD